MAQPMLPASAYEALDLPQETVKLLTTPKPDNPSDSDIAAPNLLQKGDATPEHALAPNESSIVLYAELLLHIRTVTLFASLRTLHTRETKAKLSTDGYTITVTHEGESATIRVPIQVQGGGDAALVLPAQPPSKELTLRLQIEEKEGTDMLGLLQSEERKANLVPWDGATLQAMNNVKICCKGCYNDVFPENQVREWRDLPNENWAEMMDFWHCHKPDEHHLHDHTHVDVVGKKGYAAGNRLEAVEGLGFVDLISFLLKEQDCIGVEASTAGKENSLLCRQCKRILGAPDPKTEGWRIWKWCISVAGSRNERNRGKKAEAEDPPASDITTTAATTSSSSASPPPPAAEPSHSDQEPSNQTYAVQKWISARLLSLAENTGLRKFHIYPEEEEKEATTTPIPSLLIWLFTPDLFYSSSLPSPAPSPNSPARKDPTRALKIFYKRQTYTPPSQQQPGTSFESASVEDVAFPRMLFEELGTVLEGSQRVLPESARRFQGWDVGLLERFDV